MSNADHMPLKRTSDDLGSGVCEAMATNGADSVDATSDAKKVKLENSPSRVVHVRNVPPVVTEADIIQLGIPFGSVTNVLMLKGKNQAFLELADVEQSARMVNYFSSTSAQLRGHTVYVQFSVHRELKTNQAHSNSNASTQAAIQAAGAMSSGDAGSGQASNTVLRVLVENMLYPVTLDVLYEIFSRVGRVLRIVTFTKTGSFQALIQYPDVITAQAAKMQLDSQNIYNQCCTLRVQFSRLSTLSVRFNNDKSRDYTNPDLPSGYMSSGGVAMPGMVANGGAAPGAAPMAAGPRPGFLPPMNQPQAMVDPYGNVTPSTNQQQRGVGGSVLLVSNLDEQRVTPDGLFNLFGAYGDVLRVKILFNKKDNALIQMREPEHASLAMMHLDSIQLWGQTLRVAPSRHTTIQMPRADMPDEGLNRDYTNSLDHRYRRFAGGMPLQHIYRPTNTLHLSSLSTGTTENDVQMMFNGCGFAVEAVKFIAAKRDGSAAGGGGGDAGAAAQRRDFCMALVQLSSISDAIEALMKLHLKELNGSRVRVSFTKSTI